MLSTSAANWDQDWLIKQVEQLANDPDTGPLHVLQIKETHFSGVRMPQHFRSSLTSASACWGRRFWDIAKALARSLGDRLADADSSEPLTEQDLVGRARLIVLGRYDLEDSQLTTVSVERLGQDSGTVR